MKRVVTTTVLILAGAVSALAQTSTTQPTPPAVSPDVPKTTDAPRTPAAPSMTPSTSSSTTTSPAPSTMDKSALGGPAAGANSFTENQAKARLESNGFTNVTSLKKDDSGVWRATAQKDGKSQTVSLDYQGNITAQ